MKWQAAKLHWWVPILSVAIGMLVTAIGSAVWDGPVPPDKFGNAAEWASAFGTVLAVSIALLQRQETKERVVLRETSREQRAVRKTVLGDAHGQLELISRDIDSIPQADGVDVASARACIGRALSVLRSAGDPALVTFEQELTLLNATDSSKFGSPTTSAEALAGRKWLTECGECVAAAAAAALQQSNVL